MIGGFDHPGFWYAALALPALLALYLWWRRSTRLPVAAIFLWEMPEAAPESGSRWQLRKLPLSFFLELLILLSLLLAAVGPYRMGLADYPPLFIILDDSYSMRAAPSGGVSPRATAAARIRKRLADETGRRVVFILAGSRPRLISDRRDKVDFEAFWRCADPGGDLAGAVALARSRADGAELWIVSDRAPDFELGRDVAFHAAGRALDNLALVNLRRLHGRLLLEVANFSGRSREGRIVLEPGGGGDAFVLAPGERRKLVCQLPPETGAAPVRVTLQTADDPLRFDNEAVILSEAREPVAFRLAAGLPEAARRDLAPVFRDNGDYRPAGGEAPELLIGPAATPPGPYHRLIWHTGAAANATVGPETAALFAGNPLTRGLSLEELRWPADPALRLPGAALIRRGDAVLLSFQRRIDGFVDLHLNLRPEGSNLARQPFWPVFFWNLADFLKKERSGPERANYRAGETVRVRVNDPGVAALRRTGPDGSSDEVRVMRRTAYFADLAAGVYEFEPVRTAGGRERWRIAVAALSDTESDLGGAGAFEQQAAYVAPGEIPRLPLGWALLLAAAAVLMFHQYRLGGGRRRL